MLDCTGKNKAKTAVSMAAEAKPEEKYGGDPKNQLFDPGFLLTPSDNFLAKTYHFATIQNVTDRWQTTVRQTDRQTTQCAKGATDSMVGQ